MPLRMGRGGVWGNTMHKILAAAAALLALATAGAANAAVHTWTLQDVVFSDGATASGSFDYDADTGVASAWDITSTTGATLDGFHYTTANSVSHADFLVPNDVLFQTNTADRYIHFLGERRLDAPGLVALIPYGTPGVLGSYECNNCSPYRPMSGFLFADAGGAPEPITWALMIGGFGMAGAGLRRRRTLA
jgi:hypothetical protein